MKGQFAPVELTDGFPRIEDHGLIADGTTAALVSRAGVINWLCVPRFDSPPLFAAILDAERGGCFAITPEDLIEARQAYEPDSPVLITELRTRSGLVRLTDLLPLRAGADLGEPFPAGRQELLRSAEVVEGSVRLRVRIEPRGGVDWERWTGGLRLRCRTQTDLDLYILSDRPLEGADTAFELAAGERFNLTLQWCRGPRRHQLSSPDDLVTGTIASWRRWAGCFSYDGPRQDLVRRSALTLKALDHTENGAIVAAPTSSLPEAIGGPRNWDYRYTWIRDAAFTVHALRRIGLAQEAWAFLGWVLDVAERGGRPRVLYNLDGEQPPPEWDDPDLRGYRFSAPVRWGNAAADQQQHDVYGEIVDCAYQWAAHNGALEEHLWSRLVSIIERARRSWDQPDHGIWEVRTADRPFTYSAALCQVALDRGARLAEQNGFSGDIEGWRQTAETIREAIIETSWNPRLQSFTQNFGQGGLDASLLTLPLRRVIPADHPRMVATTEAVRRHLDAGQGLLYRYHPDESPDGLPGKEGAFLLCSFWLVDNLALQGRLDEAMQLYESLCDRANPLGLLPEQIDPGTGAFLGNYPQAFSHVGLIASGVVLARLTR